MEYTKGKWEARRNAIGSWTIQTKDTHIGEIDRHFNANLIASAPDLYEALEKIFERADRGLPLSRDIHLIPAKQALAKAKGKE